MRVLVHRQHRHPVSGVIREAELAVHLPHSFGKGTTARHDQYSTRTRGVRDGCEHGVEVRRGSKQTAANLDDDVDNGIVFRRWSFVRGHHQRPTTSDQRRETKDENPAKLPPCA